MMRKIILVCLLVISTCAVPVPPEPRFLCSKDEQVIFGCNLGKKALSLCASVGTSAPATFQYRFGTSNHMELQFPVTFSPAKDHFWFSRTAYSGGGATHIRFENAGYEYVLFDSVTRTNFGKSGRNDPKLDSGILVLREGKTVSLRHCTNDTALVGDAYEQIPQEEYKYYDKIP